mmetsp:Transcript_124383/g.311009  ORF Transcript_124383/g.311009 Transcript_124383/m.311009 type:complete len:265 (+) Transcript_124383:171-965(+)
MISEAVPKKGPGFRGSSIEGRGIAGSNVSANAFFWTTERHTSVQQFKAVPVAPAAKPESTSCASLLDTIDATPLLYTSKVRKKPPVHKHCLTCMPAYPIINPLKPRVFRMCFAMSAEPLNFPSLSSCAASLMFSSGEIAITSGTVPIAPARPLETAVPCVSGLPYKPLWTMGCIKNLMAREIEALVTSATRPCFTKPITPWASKKPLSAAPAPVPGLDMQMALTTSAGYITMLVTRAPPQMGGKVSKEPALRLPALFAAMAPRV